MIEVVTILSVLVFFFIYIDSTLHYHKMMQVVDKIKQKNKEKQKGDDKNAPFG